MIMKNTIVTGSLIVFSDGFVWKRLSNEKAYKIKKSPDPFTYSFDKNTMRLVIVFDSDPEPPIVYDVKASEGWLKLDCISGDFEDFSMYKIK